MMPGNHDAPTPDERVEVEFLESVRKRCPFDVGVLKALGDLYTHVGRIRDGLEVDLQLSRLCPRDSQVWYNLGCSYALAGEKDKAVEALNGAVDLGYSDCEWMGRDADLETLRQDPRFERLFYRIMLGTQAELNAGKHGQG